jgi:hypothetical protein
MKITLRFILITLLAVLSINPASAGATDWAIKAQDLQASYVKMTNEKYLPCFTLSAPTVPEFTDNEGVNQNLFNEFEKIMENWFRGIEKTIIEKCRPQPNPNNWDNEVSNAINNFYTKLKAMIPNFCVKVSLSLPKFTGDQVKDGEIYNDWFNTTFIPWTDQMVSNNKIKCTQQNQDVSSELIESRENFKKWVQEAQAIYFGVVNRAIQSKFGIGSYIWTVTTPQPSIDDYNNPTLEKLGVYEKTLAKWADNEIKNLRIENFTGQVINSKDTALCQTKLKEKSVALDPSSLAYNQYVALWKDTSKLKQLLNDKNWSIKIAYNEYSSLIETEIARLNKIWQIYDIDGNLKSICSQTTEETYGQWTTIERYRTDLIISFNQLQELISQIYNAYETQEQNNSYDDPAVFYEQVDHYYMKYVTSQIDWLKSLGINFSFLNVPPSKPAWTNTKDGSNAKLVNDFISVMSKWWSVEAPRIQEAYLQFNLKNIQTWSKNLQISWSEYVIRVALEKFGAGGTYKFVNSIPNPSQNLINNPTASLMENYEDELNNWATLEIQNLKIENYTPINNGGVESQIKVCLAAIDKAKTYTGRFDSQISYLSYAWADYNRLLEILISKNTTLLMYRVQIDQQVQSPYLSDLYDLVLPLLAGVKANCGSTSQTFKVWAETYQDIEKEILNLRNFLITISNYYEKYRFNEPKLIPQIGKVTQIVGGCRVEILNYDPTFKWYAKGNMVVDVNGIATIYNGSVDQYLSTEKPGYQTVNFIEGLFKCPGIPTLSANTIDVQAPVMSLLSLSKSELYRGESFIVSVLITDNREVNNFRISIVDKIGQTYSCYDGVAWKLRTQGDSNIGVYQIECWIRSVSYDGAWKVSGSATDLNFNSASFELAQIRVLYGDAPETIDASNTASSSDKEVISTRTVGTAQSVALIIKDIVKNEKEEALLLNAAQKISNLPKTTRSSSLNALTSIKNQINVVIETPKVCKYQNGILRRISKGVCSKTIEIIDSAGNQYVITQQVRFR